MTATVSDGVGLSEQVHLKGNLRTWQIVFLGLGYMAPMAIWDPFGLASGKAGGHVTAAYAFTLFAVLLTAFSYRSLSKAYPFAGSGYTYVQQTTVPTYGFLVGWISLLDYFMAVILSAIYVAYYIWEWYPSVPLWVIVLAFVAIITTINILGVVVALGVDVLFVIAQFVVVIATIALVLVQIHRHGVEWTAFPVYGANMPWHGVLTASVFVVYSFLGFDAVTTLSEEARDARRTIPRAVMWVAGIAGALYLVGTFIMGTLYPDVSIFDAPEYPIPEIYIKLAGMTFYTGATVVALLATVAGCMSCQLATSRLLYAMGRDGALPRKFFGYLHPRFHTPVFNMLLIAGIIAFGAIVLKLESAAYLVGFGAWGTFLSVNVASVAYFVRNPERRSVRDVVLLVVIPSIAFAAITYIVIGGLATSAWIFGGTWLAVGFVYFRLLPKRLRSKPMFDEL